MDSTINYINFIINGLNQHEHNTNSTTRNL